MRSTPPKCSHCQVQGQIKVRCPNSLSNQFLYRNAIVWLMKAVVFGPWAGIGVEVERSLNGYVICDITSITPGGGWS